MAVAEGFQEFQLSQSFSESKLQLKSRCQTVATNKGKLIGNECGVWQNEKIERITLGHSSGFMGMNKKLIVIFLDFKGHDTVQSNILQHLRQTQNVVRRWKCFDNEREKACNEIFGGDFSIVYHRKYVDKIRLFPPSITVSFHKNSKQ